MKLIESNYNIFPDILEKFKEDIEFVVKIISINGNLFKYLSINMQQNQKVIEKLIENHGLPKLYNSNSILYFIHIGLDKLDNKYTKSYIKYIFINFKDYTVTQIIKYITKCYVKNNNVVIFISLILNNYTPPIVKCKEFYKLMNKNIDSNKLKYDTVKIINIYDKEDLSYTDFLLVYCNNFRKIVNIHFIENINYIYKELYSKYIIQKLYLTDIEKYNNMLATHWINWKINTPPIMKNRQLQLSETCWLNALFNSFFLIKKIQKHMYDEYDNYKKQHYPDDSRFPLKYTELRDDTKVYNIYDVLFSIIGNLKEEIPAYVSDSNYLIVLGAYFKASIYKSDFDTTFKNYTEYKEYEKKPLYKICGANLENKLKILLCDENNEEYLNNICNYTKLNKTICDTYNPGTNEYTGYILGNFGKDSWIDFLKIIFKNLTFEQETREFGIIYNIKMLDILVIVIEKNSELKKFIVFHEKRYNLASAYLTSDCYTHAICGIINDSDYFIYDSYNIMIKDDWTQLLDGRSHNLLKYGRALRELQNTNSIIYKYYANYLIYQ